MDPPKGSGLLEQECFQFTLETGIDCYTIV